MTSFLVDDLEESGGKLNLLGIRVVNDLSKGVANL